MRVAAVPVQDLRYTIHQMLNGLKIGSRGGPGHCTAKDRAPLNHRVLAVVNTSHPDSLQTFPPETLVAAETSSSGLLRVSGEIYLFSLPVQLPQGVTCWHHLFSKGMASRYSGFEQKERS